MPTYYSPSGNPEIWAAGTQPGDYMTQGEWVAAHPIPAAPAPTLEDQLTAIDTEYAAKFEALKNSFTSAMLIDGTQMETSVALLRSKWTALIAAQQAAMDALMGA